MSDTLAFDPATMDQRALYRLLIGSVVPRPIGWASTVNTDGVANLAPFSFFTVVCVAPPMVSLTILPKPTAARSIHSRTCGRPASSASTS